ncbi:MAG: zinc ribbon domain-containing protein [Firmicutes bacterium]|nr:zinc ribbon domain-containing protein [Bacillota bacterium]
MAFCTNCGQELAEGAKFCASCGKAVDSNSTYQRKTVYDGVIHKCPNCGEVLSSFLANCPACGFEFNSKKVNSSLKEFIEEINECDRKIANNPLPAKTGWSSWSKAKRIFWVILNVIFFSLPLIIYLYVKVFSIILPLVRYGSPPKLTADEKRKVSLIENFSFPNERESILEALLFVKAKVSFLASEKIDRKNAYWIRLWSAKASQLYQKAEMMFKGDKTADEAYREIVAQRERVAKTVKVKAIAYTIALIAIIVFLSVKNGTFDDIKLSNTPLEIPETELSVLMPQIEGGKGEVVTNNSEYFSVEYYGISESEFEAYKKDCKNRGFTIDCESTGSLFDAFNEDGYNIRITYYSSEMHITVSDDLEMRTIVWPSSEVADLLPTPKSDYGNISSSSDTCLIIYIGNMTIDDYAEYVNECIKKGFTKDISQTDDHYHADNADGYHVMVEYRGFNTVFIRIDD